MAKNYSFEKGKYGTVTGTIIPFGRYLDGNTPEGSDWTTYIPAGYLRCNGLIYRARDFRALAQVLGIGSDCKYRKDGVTLEEATDDLRLGQFQLPDLGSKYIKAANSNGIYDNMMVFDPVRNTFTERVGLEVELTLNRGNLIETTYNGSFTVPTTEVPFPSTQNFASTLGTQIPAAEVQADNLLAHGHFSNAAVVRSGPFTGRMAVWSGDLKTGFTADTLESFTAVGGSASGTSHNHSLSRSTVSRSTTHNINAFSASADQIVTTTRLSVDNTFKMDDLQHKYILVEYLIKT
jgi:hypothetical protein